MSERADGLTPEVRDLFDAYCDNVIDEERLRRLERLLLDDEGLRREFVAYFQLHTELHFLIRAGRASDAVLKRIGDEPIRSHPPSSRWRRRAAAATVAAAALLVIGAGIWLRTGGRRPTTGPSSPPAVAAARPKIAVDAGLAMVIRLVGVRWEDGDVTPPAEGDLLAPGHLRFRSGRVVLSMLTGVSLELEGPADLELISDDHVFCHTGRLRAHVPEGSEGFVVSGPGSAVVDMGTEFGLNVDPAGKTRGKVFRGKVEAALVTRTGVYRRSRVMTDRERPFAIDPHAGSIDTDPGREEFVAGSDRARTPLALDPGYPAAVLRSGPRSYWRFGSMAAGAIPNEIPGGPSLRAAGPLRLSATAGSNTSVVFEAGHTEQYLEMEGLWEPPRRPGRAVELWFQSDAIGHLALATLFTDDPPLHGASEPRELPFSFFLELTSRMRTRLHQPASVRLLHRFPPGYDGGDNLYSGHCYVPTRWHHLVGQLNDDRMELFLDAEPTATLAVDPAYRCRPSRLLLGRLTTIPSDPTRPRLAHEHTSRPFVGQIDEVALYDRPLSVDEIRLHYRLASGEARP